MSDKPKRIQRKRTKGWKMPEGAVYVGRPTKWGNPFSSRWYQVHGIDAARAVALFRNTVTGYWNPSAVADLHDNVVAAIYKDHHKWAFHRKHLFIESDLRGKDLACWCPLSQTCHADVLLELANATQEPT